jgi:hypothetical protein
MSLKAIVMLMTRYARAYDLITHRFAHLILKANDITPGRMWI